MTIISSTFDADAEGWKATQKSSTEWRPTGGDPDGYLHWQDERTGHSIASYVAPKPFRGDLSEFLGGRLSFDLFDTGSGNNAKRGVLLIGANGVELYAEMDLPGSDWTHYAVRFTAGNWHLGSTSGTLATKDQIADVLDHVARFRIQADFGTGTDQGGLDNVTLASRDELARPVFGADGPMAETHPVAAHDALLHPTVALA